MRQKQDGTQLKVYNKTKVYDHLSQGFVGLQNTPLGK